MSVVTTTTNAATTTWLDRVGRANLVMMGLLLAAFLAVGYPWMWKQFGPWGFSAKHMEDWGHAYLVPLICIFYIWKRRDQFAALPVGSCWTGLPMMLMGLMCYFFFTVGFSNHMFQGFSLVLTLAGLVLTVLGPAIFKASFFPIAFLGFAVTISEMVMNKVTWGLKLLASEGGFAMLNMMGVETELVGGNRLDIWLPAEGIYHPLHVAEACSGMRMVVAFIALAVAMAFISCDKWWKRIALIELAIPVALLMNIVRVAVLGLMVRYVNPDLADGNAHTIIGTILLVPSLAFFFFCAWLLDRIVVDEAPERAKGGGST
ncbi:MAG: exosortase [Phycisphaerales bacterium]|nr:exosortase [Phycisphaerales bacterium]